MKPENVRMGKRIAAAREARAWSKADLARKAGVAASYVTRIEQGKFDRPSIDLVSAIARALRVSVAELTGVEMEQATRADMRAALHAMGYRPDEAPVVDALVAKLLDYSPRQRRQILDLMASAIEIADTDDQPFEESAQSR